ncbi:PspA/IM30 family protein [Archaeoglobus sp.]
MSLLKRILRIAKAEAHAVVDKLEDPIKVTEEGIRELKKQLNEAIESLAQVKASQIRFEKEAINERERAKMLVKRAEAILAKAKAGEISEEEAQKKVAELLEKAEIHERNARSLEEQAEKQKETALKLQAKIEELKNTIAKYEAELKTLKARYSTAKAMKKINKQLAKVDPSDTIAMLERMKEKVEEEEALAMAYEEIAKEEIEESKIESVDTAQKLEELKKRLGL